MEQHRNPEQTIPQDLTEAVQEPRGRNRTKRWFAVPFLAASLVAAAAFLPPDSPHASPAPVLSATAAPAPATPTPTLSSAAMVPVPAAAPPTGLTFPAAGIDMAVLPLTPSQEDLAAQSLVPPPTTDAYWLTPYGVPGTGSMNTTYIAGHSWDGKDAPFNRLSNTSLLGTELTLTTETGELAYIVDSVTTHDKDTLKDSDIWNIIPNRVVLISCYTEDPWGKNVIVTALPKTT